MFFSPGVYLKFFKLAKKYVVTMFFLRMAMPGHLMLRRMGLAEKVVVVYGEGEVSISSSSSSSFPV